MSTLDNAINDYLKSHNKDSQNAKVNNRVRDIVCNIKSTQMIEPCHSIEEVEKAFFKYINDLKVKMKVF